MAKLIPSPSLPYAEQIKRLTIDPGARRVGEILDDMQAWMDALQAQVDSCCPETLARKPTETVNSKPASTNDSPPSGTTTNH